MNVITSVCSINAHTSSRTCV